MKRMSEAIAKFIWNQLGLDPEETLGHDHFDRQEFAEQIQKLMILEAMK